MFSVFGGTETRRLPGASQFPWKEIVLATIVLIVLAGIGYGVNWIVFRDISTPTVPALEQSSNAAPVSAESTAGEQSEPVAQSVQQVPEVVAPVAPRVVNHQVTWTEVNGFDPSAIPVEEGLYNGKMPQVIDLDSINIPEHDKLAWKILPHLKEVGVGSQVAAARAPENKDVILVSIRASRFGDSALLSVDGEKSWCMLNLLPRETNPTVYEVRIRSVGGEVLLYGRDGRPGNHWWETVVSKSKLPCS